MLIDIYQTLNLEPNTLLKECKISYYQGHGAGGQKRNKVKTAVRLQHTLTQKQSECNVKRTIIQNTELALFELKMSLARTELINYNSNEIHEILVNINENSNWPKFRTKINEFHKDRPMILFQALLSFALTNSFAKAAILLNCSTSALIKLLKNDKRIWLKIKDKKINQ